jgi:hypothetical protein
MAECLFRVLIDTARMWRLAPTATVLMEASLDCDRRYDAVFGIIVKLDEHVVEPRGMALLDVLNAPPVMGRSTFI